MLLRIAAIRPNTVMVADARGGLGGTSGCRAADISQASAMLTFGLAKNDAKIGVAQTLSGLKSRRHEGARTGNNG
jgi:hypothetical protein